MRVQTPIKPRFWSEKDDETLIQEYRKWHSTPRWYMRVSQKLNRTGGSVQTRIKHLKERGLT